MWRTRPTYTPPPPPPVPDDSEELKEKRRESTEALLDAIHQGPEARRIGHTFNQLRRTNGFEALFDRSMWPKS